MKIRPKRIFVTSNFKTEQVFAGPILSALLSRFDLFYFDEEDKDVRYIPRRSHNVSDRFLRCLNDVLQESEQVPQAVPSTSKMPTAAEANISEDEFEVPKKCNKKKK